MDHSAGTRLLSPRGFAVEAEYSGSVLTSAPASFSDIFSILVGLSLLSDFGALMAPMLGLLAGWACDSYAGGFFGGDDILAPFWFSGVHLSRSGKQELEIMDGFLKVERQ